MRLGQLARASRGSGVSGVNKYPKRCHRVGQGVRKVEAEVASPSVSPVARASPPAAVAAAAAPDKPAASERERLRQREQERRRREAVST